MRYTKTTLGTNYASKAALDQNFDDIKTAIDDSLSRKGDSPNQMEADLDMNSNQILNLPDAISPGEPVTLRQFNAQSVGTKTTQTLKQKHTATAGQTVFVTPQYVIGSNNLSVYINGVRQDSAAYSETTTTSVTLSEGVEAGDIVEVLVNELQESADQVGAASVTYDGSTVDEYLDKYKHHDTVALAKANTALNVGDRVKTWGYTTAGDGGGAEYLVVAGGTGTDDAGSYHDMSNGNQLQLLIENGELHSKVFGIIHDDSTDNTTQLGKFFDYLIANPSVTGVIDAGVALSDEISKAAANGIKLRGCGAIKATGSVRNNFIFFSGVQSKVDIDGITIDGANLVAQPLRIENDTAGADGSVYLGKTFTCKNADNDAANSFTSAAVRIDGSFSEVVFDGEIDNVDNQKTSGGVSVGLWVEWSTTRYVKRTVIGSSARIKNIQNQNTSVADADGVQITAPTGNKAHLSVVPGAYFENCEGRAIKSQVQGNSIVGAIIKRDAYDGLTEIDLQYAGGIVTGCQFHHNGARVNDIITVSQRATPDNTHATIVGNELIITGTPSSDTGSMVFTNVTAAAVKNLGIRIRDNTVKGSVAHFLRTRNDNTLNNHFMVVDGNYVETISSEFVEASLFGASRANVIMVFTNNTCEGGCTGGDVPEDMIIRDERNNYGITALKPTIFKVTIATGSITVYGNVHRVDTEASAATDDLSTINLPANFGRGTNELLTLLAADDARTVVVKDNTGNIRLAGGDFSLDNTHDRIILAYDAAASEWIEVTRSDNDV